MSCHSSFANIKNPVDARKRVMNLYSNIKRRIESRFMVAGRVPGKVFMVSSKNRDSDFLESYMKSVAGRPDVLITDEPIWVVKGHKLALCGKTFRLAIGGRLLPHKIISDDEDPESLKELGYRLMDVPIEYKDSFKMNMEKALNDIAGIATEAGSKFMVVNNIRKVLGTTRNGFTVDILKIGLHTPYSIQDFFDVNRIKEHFGKKIYIHLDLSKSGDRTGIGIVLPEAFSNVSRVDTLTGKSYQYTDIKYRVLGAVGLQALEGSEIPYFRIKEFIDWLMINFKIVSVTADGFQSLEMVQYYTLKKINSRVLSLDRTPDGYYTFRSAIDDERILLPDMPELGKELVELEQLENGKVDHPYDESGHASGTKDISDGICGAVYAASLDKDNSSIVDRSKEKALENLNSTLNIMLDTGTDDDLFQF